MATQTPEHITDAVADAARLVRQRAYWQAHEALEDCWRSLPPSAARELLHALIQTCAACHKVEQAAGGRDPVSMRRGLDKLIERARGHLRAAAQSPPPPATFPAEPVTDALDGLAEVHVAWGQGRALVALQAAVEVLAVALADGLEGD